MMLAKTEELNRVIPVVELILKHFPETLISVDTFRSVMSQNKVLKLEQL